MRPRLFLRIAAMEAKKTLAYRVDFWITAIVSFFTAFGLAWFLWRAIYDAAPTATLNGFTFRGMILYMVVVIMLRRIVRGAGLDTRVSGDIYLGGLNRYVVFPLRYLPFKYAQHLGTLFPTLIQFVVFALAFLLFIGIPDDVSLGPINAIACLGALIVASVLYFLMTFVFECVAFWADNVWSLLLMLEFVALFLGGVMVPLALFQPEWRVIIEWTPFPICFSTPALALLGKIDASTYARQIGVGLVWCAIFAGLCRWIWRRGALRYSGVGI